MKIRTFHAPAGEYLDTYRTMENHGWHILRVTLDHTHHGWRIRAANRDWFFSLPPSEQRRIACQEAGPLRRLSDVLPVKESLWNRVVGTVKRAIQRISCAAR